MWRGDGLRASQIGDGARQLEDAVEGARRELQPLHRRAQEWLRRRLDLADTARTSAGPISALQVTRGALAKRRAWIARAARTRSRTVAERSASLRSVSFS